MQNKHAARAEGASARRETRERFSPSALSRLHHRRGDRRGRASKSHAGVGIDDRNDFASAVGLVSRRLVEVGVIKITGNTGLHVGIGLGGRERNGWSDLLNRLNLVLQG